RSVQRWIALGKLPARRVGGRWRVASGALDALQASQAPDDTEGTATAPGIHPVPPIRRVFIANRGEIARRIRRTAERLGMAVIEPASEGPAAFNLLDVDSVVEAAHASGADAVHPGFGFLAENADFAAAVEAAGILW